MNTIPELYSHILSHCEANNISIDCRFSCFTDMNVFLSHDITFSVDCIHYEADNREDIQQFVIDYIDTLWEHCTPPCNRIAFYFEDIICMGDWYEIVMGGALFEEV